MNEFVLVCNAHSKESAVSGERKLIFFISPKEIIILLSYFEYIVWMFLLLYTAWKKFKRKFRDYFVEADNIKY